MSKDSFQSLQQYIEFPIGENRSIRIRVELMAILVILVAGASLRFWDLNRWSLWTDELYTWKLVPTLRILEEGIPDDQHPPLFYILLHYLVQINDSETWLRLPSAIAGFLAIPMMWRIGVILDRRRWGLLAAALLAISPLHIWYSREARMYGFVSLLWILSILFYLKVLQRDNWLDALGLAVFTIAGILTAYPTLALWFIEISLFLLIWNAFGAKTVRLLRWLLAQGVIAAGFKLWWPYFQQQLDRSTTFNWPILPSLGLDLSGTLEETLQWAMIVAMVAIAAAICLSLVIIWNPSIWHWLKKRTGIAAKVTIFLFISATVLGAIPRGLSIRRQLLVFWPPMIMLGAWSLASLRKKKLSRIVLALSLVLSLFTITGSPYEDWRGVSNHLTQTASEPDVILLSPGWIGMGLEYYYQGNVPYAGVVTQEFATADLKKYNSGQRVWFLYWDYRLTRSNNEIVLSWFKTNAKLHSSQSFSGDIYLNEYEINYSLGN